ncbi:MAG: Flp pilus assembly protein CpaB [Actinobacteria bacterium]|nr:Flp pilus assembly protein CpaB [Actinomycetota bacterium]
MRLRIVLLFIAVILGVVAVVGVLAYVNSIRTSVEREVEKVEVLVAAQNIPKETPVETIISTNSVVAEAIPRKYLADGVLTTLDNYKGYVVAAPINKGEQITSTKFIKPEEIGLAFLVPVDMVAVSIPVNEVIGVSNLINVGDKVNVIATFKPTQQAGATPPETTEAEEAQVLIQKEITKTLLWNVEVLYVGTRIVTEKTPTQEGGILGGQDEQGTKEIKITTVTLAVTPQDSEKLVFSEEMGSVWLALLPTKGIEKEETLGRTLDNIFQ